MVNRCPSRPEPQSARARGEWGEKQQAEIGRFRRQYPLESNTAWDAYLEWYENNADAHIGKIKALYQRLLAEFPLTEWEDATSILDTTSNRALKEAKELARNNVFAVPRQQGIDYAPTFGLPYDWPRELQPSSKFLDLLADPDMQQAAIDTAVSQLQTTRGTRTDNRWGLDAPEPPSISPANSLYDRNGRKCCTASAHPHDTKSRCADRQRETRRSEGRSPGDWHGRAAARARWFRALVTSWVGGGYSNDGGEAGCGGPCTITPFGYVATNTGPSHRNTMPLR